LAAVTEDALLNNDTILQLYPQPGGEVALKGLYLDHDLRQYGDKAGRAYIYSNYVVSLDGRIAIPRAEGRGMEVPKATANERDWRLFQELAIQADIIISSGRYLRDYEKGQTQEILAVYDKPEFADLRDWRTDRGLSPQPDLAVVSGSLDFAIPQVLIDQQRRVIVFTDEQADKDRVAELRRQAGEVIIAGTDKVAGRPLADGLTGLGYRTVFMGTGPQVHRMLLADDVVDRFYLTFANRFLGADPFSSVIEGPLLPTPVGVTLNAAYQDPHALDGLGQLFLSYNR
jgi:riboflavin biosynthesis pyrimidine reductase